MVIATGGKILIPKIRMLEAKVFEAGTVAESLRLCQQAGFEAIFAPEIADARIEAAKAKEAEVVKEAEIWQRWYDTASLIATGKTRSGNSVIVIAHIPNYFLRPENIEAAVGQGLVNGAGIMPQEEFYRLAGMEDGRNVFVVNYDAVIKAGSDRFGLAQAEKHPLAAPFVGSKDKLEAYLNSHKRVFGEKIGIWYGDRASDVPVGRLLAFGYVLNGGVLVGDGRLDGYGRFVGVSSVGGAEGASPRKQVSPLEELLGKARDAGNDMLVINVSDISLAAYNALTGAK